jgi:hypothetical protein
VRRLDRVLGEAIKRAWAAGAVPDAKRLVIDIDSFLGEAKGRLKKGASRGTPGLALAGSVHRGARQDQALPVAV